MDLGDWAQHGTATSAAPGSTVWTGDSRVWDAPVPLRSAAPNPVVRSLAQLLGSNEVRLAGPGQYPPGTGMRG